MILDYFGYRKDKIMKRPSKSHDTVPLNNVDFTLPVEYCP
jgi:hypothetical protein